MVVCLSTIRKLITLSFHSVHSHHIFSGRRSKQEHSAVANEQITDNLGAVTLSLVSVNTVPRFVEA